MRLVEVEPRTGTSLVGLPDSLRRRLRPLRIALVEPEQVNSRDEVLQFEVQADTALIDSVLMSAWSAEADVSTH